ncbi:LPXTG cell wall anchor domain-containing protein [Weissella confusa]|uniref:LPXTG cell wall anchor domain-containing protein n=1 Tax=Weissella confusa TaxID=1583 RepID=UPI00189F685B|nr:LPXTG cell wall anchor domain-containing protein [Weissella confusa]MBF7057713.1 LPXTG cell wall anchor domain-containing protein [Weissella confusa]
MFTGSFYVQNDAKSIFPRVGGTGIQAYIGAGVIIMLIAGGAAWYIKRRQNQ